MKKRLKRTKRVESLGTGEPRKDVFSGEIMTCAICEKQKRSSTQKESGWTAIQLENNIKCYFCPACWHTVGKHYGYENMVMIAYGIAMGVDEIRDLARRLIL